jgi:hypothetical protein
MNELEPSFPIDFAKQERAIELLWTIVSGVEEVLNGYVLEEITATQALHSCLVITGQNHDDAQIAIAAALADSLLQHGSKRASRL